MKKYILPMFQVVTKIIIILLSLSTFFIQRDHPDNTSDHLLVKLFSLDHFYNSGLNLFLFSLFILLILFAVGSKRLNIPIQVVLHLVLALAFIVIIYDKTCNEHNYITLCEGETLQFSEAVKDPKHNHTIKLEKFMIDYHDDYTNMVKAYTSQLIIDNRDTTFLQVNKPVKIGHYRLYQNAYDKIPLYHIKIDEAEFNISIDDTLTFNNNSIYISMAENRRTITVHFNEQQKRISPMGGTFTMNEFEFDLKMEDVVFQSIIEVASVRGMVLLLVLGLAYLTTLGIAFWRKKP
ncbi:MAG: cytochrome c biogenesis protein ResB [Candidatus Marinimicrobia bacterium]|nr:cytochrome c biogenesis protein ResB [Candidatus Neomarinimicrobiota bacterium]